MSFLKKLKSNIAIEEITGKKKAEVSPEIKKEDTTKAIKNRQKDKKRVEPKQKPKKTSEDWSEPDGQLVVDVFNTDSEFCIQAPIAGTSSEDLDISVENEMLIIKGEREKPEIAKEKNYFYQECYWGSFSRQVILPEDVDLSKIKASLQKGVLTIRIPKGIRIRKKKINVISGD